MRPALSRFLEPRNHDSGYLRMLLRGGPRHGARMLRFKDGKVIYGRRHRTLRKVDRLAFFMTRVEAGKPVGID